MLFQMVKELSESAQGTARTLYECRGWTVHHNTDLWRMAGPVDGASYVWPLGGAWLSQHLWQHYLYTGDQAFLKTAYPALKGAADFFLDFLVDTQIWLDGLYTFYVSRNIRPLRAGSSTFILRPAFL